MCAVLEISSKTYYKLYNYLCPGMGEPDSNIVEYAEEVLEIVENLINIIDNK